MRDRLRKTILCVVMLSLVLTAGVSVQARGKGFKDVVKHFEQQYGAKRTRIPMLGLANFAVKLIRPAGVKGFKLAVFEDQNFKARPDTLPFATVMREAYNKDWSPLVQVNSKRDGGTNTVVFVRQAKKDIHFALVVLEQSEAVVLEVRFNPDAAAKFLENPKIMGISLGNSVRGNKADIALNPNSGSNSQNSGNVANRSSNSSASPSDVTIESISKPRPSINAPAPSANDQNNPPLGNVDAKAGVKTDEIKTDEKSVANVKAYEPDKDAIRIETRLVNLNVKAMDRAGQPVIDLKPADFTVYEDGIKQEVSHFKPVNAPVNLILLLDLSGSTKKKRGAMKMAAARFIDTLPAQDNVAIVAFTRRYRALTGFTNDKAKLKSVLEDINGLSGGTAFYDSMWKALDELDQINDARKAIVVLTDGEDESIDGSEPTDHTFEQLLERSSEEDVTIYPIYFSASNPYDKIGVLFGSGSIVGNDKARTARKQLDDMAQQTGGEVFNAQREEDLEDAYKRVASELHMLYSLAYSPDKPKHNGEFRKITVKLTRDGAVARTRRGYIDR